MPALALVLGDIRCVIGVDAIPHRTWPLEHPAVLPGLQVEPVNLAAFVADDCKVAARGDGDGGNRVTDSVGDTLSIHLRRGLEDVLAEDAVGEPPRVRACLPRVARHHVGPIALAHVTPRDAANGRKFQLLLCDFKLLRPALDVRLAQLLGLLVLDGAEHPQGAVVTGG